jgi:hypothetical protein
LAGSWAPKSPPFFSAGIWGLGGCCCCCSAAAALLCDRAGDISWPGLSIMALCLSGRWRTRWAKPARRQHGPRPPIAASKDEGKGINHDPRIREPKAPWWCSEPSALTMAVAFMAVALAPNRIGHTSMTLCLAKTGIISPQPLVTHRRRRGCGGGPAGPPQATPWCWEAWSSEAHPTQWCRITRFRSPCALGAAAAVTPLAGGPPLDVVPPFLCHRVRYSILRSLVGKLAHFHQFSSFTSVSL